MSPKAILLSPMFYIEATTKAPMPKDALAQTKSYSTHSENKKMHQFETLFNKECNKYRT